MTETTITDVYVEEPDVGDDIEAARRMLEAKLQALEPLAMARAREAALVAQLDDVRREYAKAYRAVRTQNWSAEELEALRYSEPTAPAGRSRTPRPTGTRRAVGTTNGSTTDAGAAPSAQGLNVTGTS
jgi:hypothetical protein